jgi:transcriptional regulator with XRE-family HTH domain
MRRMNPQDAVKALIASGWTEQRIAAEAGTSQPTINRIKNGRHRASFDVGQALITLARRTPAAADATAEAAPAVPLSEAA